VNGIISIVGSQWFVVPHNHSRVGEPLKLKSDLHEPGGYFSPDQTLKLQAKLAVIGDFQS
jgi:hypothetical protein